MTVIELDRMKKEMNDGVLRYINNFFDKHFRQPMLYEIERATGMNERMLCCCLMDMRDSGKLYFDSHYGTIITPHMREQGVNEVVHLDVMGHISCGIPEEETEGRTSFITLPKFMVGSGEFFVLVAEGNSMTGAGIDHGDFVIIQKHVKAKAGNIVVALNDDSETTLKTLLYDKTLNRYYLHPENPIYDDIYPEELFVQGVAVKVLKNL